MSKPITTYDRRPERCSSGRLFHVLAWMSAALQVVSLYLVLIQLAAIWFAHIGMDRTVGYGLKYASAFKATHLQRV